MKDRLLLGGVRYGLVVLVSVTLVGIYRTRSLAEGTLLVAIGAASLLALYRLREF